MQTFLKGKRVGYWLSEKKIKKLNFQAFAELCRKRGIEVIQLDLTKPIEDQGPLDVIIHKLTDVILEADQNDSQSLELVYRFQEYIDAHPETIILDPLPAIRTLLDRSKSYELIRRIEAYMQDERICSPPFMELTSACGEDTLQVIEKNGLAFPFICKTRVAHGTNSHEMAIIFNQEGLKAIQPPCVIQSFINHNAVLYKVFVVGESYTVVKRPSLKNFSAGISDRESIFFNSHNVSKPESSSVLTALDKIEGVFERPNDDVIREISKALRQALGVSLFGIDIIINNQTGQHAVIDINAFPDTGLPLKTPTFPVLSAILQLLFRTFYNLVLPFSVFATPPGVRVIRKQMTKDLQKAECEESLRIFSGAFNQLNFNLSPLPKC
ncbi:inositol-tetrakisphosphate 1-kinase isoform X2 [Emys orbicularis]|uniref:inositol-tetrakisphosphate 1-kinase isoform X2 n=1 Tax=Emys orbicularis TaxID=82168 RepID=UPI0031FCBCAE